MEKNHASKKYKYDSQIQVNHLSQVYTQLDILHCDMRALYLYVKVFIVFRE